MPVNGLSLFSHIHSHSTWLFEFGMFFFMRLVSYVVETQSFEVLSLVLNSIWIYFLIRFCQGVKIVFKVGLALLKYCHDDLVSIEGILFCFRPMHDVISIFPSYSCMSVSFSSKGEITLRETHTRFAQLPWGCDGSGYITTYGLLNQGTLSSLVPE